MAMTRANGWYDPPPIVTTLKRLAFRFAEACRLAQEDERAEIERAREVGRPARPPRPRFHPNAQQLRTALGRYPS